MKKPSRANMRRAQKYLDSLDGDLMEEQRPEPIAKMLDEAEKRGAAKVRAEWREQARER